MIVKREIETEAKELCKKPQTAEYELRNRN